VAFQARMRKVVAPVRRPATRRGIPNRRLNPIAAPRNSARSVAIATISMRATWPYTVQRASGPGCAPPVPTGGDAQLGGEGLDEHGHQICSRPPPRAADTRTAPRPGYWWRSSRIDHRRRWRRAGPQERPRAAGTNAPGSCLSAPPWPWPPCADRRARDRDGLCVAWGQLLRLHGDPRLDRTLWLATPFTPHRSAAPGCGGRDRARARAPHAALHREWALNGSWAITVTFGRARAPGPQVAEHGGIPVAHPDDHGWQARRKVR